MEALTPCAFHRSSWRASGAVVVPHLRPAAEGSEDVHRAPVPMFTSARSHGHMIWVRTSASRRSTHRTPMHVGAGSGPQASPLEWLRDRAVLRGLTGLDGPWHLVSSEDTPVMSQFHWSLARPSRTSRRWAEQCVTRGPSWITTLEQQPALLSITVEGAAYDAGTAAGLPEIPGSYQIVQRSRWSPDPAPLGLDLQLLTMGTDAGMDVRLTFVNCFVDPDRFELAHRTFVERLETRAAA